MNVSQKKERDKRPKATRIAFIQVIAFKLIWEIIKPKGGQLKELGGIMRYRKE